MTSTWRSTNLDDRLNDITDDARIAPEVATLEVDQAIEATTTPLTRAQATRLTERIKLQAQVAKDSLSRLQELVGRARAGQAHVALGFASWTAYLADVFAAEPLRLEREQRQEIVGYLAGEGMSTRAIAPIIGASQKTVDRDIRRESNDSPAGQPTIIVDRVTGEVLDAPDPQPVIGLDGKRYERPAPPPAERPVASPLDGLVRDLERVVGRLEALGPVDDERLAGLRDRLVAVVR